MAWESKETLRRIAAEESWPVDQDGNPLCDRCGRVARRVEYSHPGDGGAVFFCEDCESWGPAE